MGLGRSCCHGCRLSAIRDPLTLAAGLARLRFLAFLLPVALGKVGRYFAVFYLADWVSAA
jgi:membrane protein YqaA with SNARE-associated domain